ncbi:MAG: class I SAM-dependent methyltransferase [Candidatus Parcubacteria bacterium]|nr:class I SAM-dependent methyltransferase [Burkholderiales bacterium]
MNMNDPTLVELSQNRPRLPPLTGLARRVVFARLAGLEQGTLLLREGAETIRFGNGAPEVEIEVRNPAFYAEIAFGGSVGAGESYMLGHWAAQDLTALVRLLLRNRGVLDGMEGGLAQFAAPLRVVAHWLHRNTRAGSRRNISAHYDIGNDFYRLFLDDTMMYSCALFEHPGMTLEQAQTAKLDAICRKLALGPQDHVLEIGTGWGGFALHAASRYGCRVTTTTISPSQHAFAIERVRAAGLGDRITLLLRDYRDLEGSYDKLASIEMIEAVGHQYYGEYFSRCDALLKPGGRMLLQAITIADQHYERARGEVDFIKRYIFPGCCIPSVTALAQAMTAASSLRMVQLEDIGLHYATTLRLWRANFQANSGRLHVLGLPASFLRMWEFYLCYCEGGFAERALGDVQFLLEKP